MANAQLIAQIECKSGLAERRQIVARLTSPRVDLVGDSILTAGIDVAEFMQNPVVLFAHDHTAPIAKVVTLERTAQALIATVQFPPPGVSEKSDEIFGLVQAGVINCLSIGLMVDETEPA